MHAIPETAITACDGHPVHYADGITVAIRILDEFPDGHAHVQIDDCGMHVRRGQVVTVPTDAIRRR